MEAAQGSAFDRYGFAPALEASLDRIRHVPPDPIIAEDGIAESEHEPAIRHAGVS
jgi:hypothetical protein